MAQSFSFDNALMHGARTDGAPGFVWRFVLSYAAGLVGLFFIVGLIGSAMPAFDGDPANLSAASVLLILVLGALYLGFWAVFEASLQRRYVLDERFSLRFGRDERNLVLVGLIWFGLAALGYLASAFVVFAFFFGASSVASSPLSLGLTGTLLFLGASAVWIFLAVRLAPASAMTVRDGRVRFFQAWGATAGRFWPLFGAYLVLSIGWMIALMLISAFFGASIYVLVGGDPGAATAGPAIGTLLLAYAFFFGLSVLFYYVWAGPAALAAKTDPRYGGGPNVAETFL
ncbi:MAG: hypothetical protein AAFX03_09765 [Pseudomonadota bacterium]